eukprot:m.370274 g.370274  ORF g.370274 m.370274 type:complete len:1200 (+) comp19991_c0_seq2:4903-8502(+)
MASSQLSAPLLIQDSTPDKHGRVPISDGVGGTLLVVGYKLSICRCALWYPLVLMTLGFAHLVASWLPKLRLAVTHAPCSIVAATKLLISHEHGTVVVPVNFTEPKDIADASVDTLRWFEHQHLRYLYDVEGATYRRCRGLDFEQTFGSLWHRASHLPGQAGCLTREQSCARFGLNLLDVEVKSYVYLLFKEILHPFFIFQVFAIVLWVFEEYYYFAAAIFVMSVVVVGINLIGTRRNLERLRKICMLETNVRRLLTAVDDQVERIEVVKSSQLVPGDIVDVPPTGMMLTCDMVLLTGGCLVNESMLTGESTPVNKLSLPTVDGGTEYSPEQHKLHTLFCGTHVIQTQAVAVRAMVLRTGFDSAKGELVRSILFPKPSRFRFYRDAIRFVGFLFALSLLGLVYAVVVLERLNTPGKRIALRSLDLITLIVPPALPAAMMVGTLHALHRLQKQDIFCISPPRINVCGKLKAACLDKTGTLTEDGLEVFAVGPVRNGRFEDSTLDVSSMAHTDRLVQGLASCHSLVQMHGDVTDERAMQQQIDEQFLDEDEDVDDQQAIPLVSRRKAPESAQLVGDPMDLELFGLTRWTLLQGMVTEVGTKQHDMTVVCPGLDSASAGDQGLVILRQFPFSSSLRRSGVVVAPRNSSSQVGVTTFVKGAPETIRPMCSTASVPENFSREVSSYTQNGYRVIALAASEAPDVSWDQALSLPREQLEAKLELVALLVFENKLKPQSAPVIGTLKAAAIRPVMVTGDDVLTASCVARKCGIIDSNSVCLLARSVEDPTTLAKKLQVVPIDEMHAVDANVQLPSLNMVRVKGHDGVARSILTGSPNEHEGVPIAIAVTGSEFDRIREQLPVEYERLLVSGAVFARMKPEQKALLVEDMQRIGYSVCFCGDGANDCSALKVADVGVSLSLADASVAAPFTSRVPDIRCVVKLVQEGRAALVTAFAVFEFLALYSFIQFTSALILYWFESTLGDIQYLWIDLCIILTLAVLVGRTQPHPMLVAIRPPGSLLSLSIALALIGQIAIQAAFQTAALLYAQHQSWYVRLVPESDSQNIKSFENTSVFLVSVYQYLVMAATLSAGEPFCTPLLTNQPFVISLMVLAAINVYITFAPDHFVRDLFELQMPHGYKFSAIILLLAFSNTIISLGYQRMFRPNSTFVRFLRRVRGKAGYKNRYKTIARDIVRSRWPGALVAKETSA